MKSLSYFFKRMLYQKNGDALLRCYEAATIQTFRSLLPQIEQRKFDQDYETHDEVKRDEGGKVFWTWCWEKSAGGVTPRSHPPDLRMYGMPGSGSTKVAEIAIITDFPTSKSFIVSVYFADGVGPSFYFDRNPEQHFGTSNIGNKVGEALGYKNCDHILDISGKLLAESTNA